MLIKVLMNFRNYTKKYKKNNCSKVIKFSVVIFTENTLQRFYGNIGGTGLPVGRVQLSLQTADQWIAEMLFYVFVIIHIVQSGSFYIKK